MILYPIYCVLCINLVTKVNSEILVLGEGIGYIEEDDIAMVFYVTVKNVCKDDLELSINMLQCCETINPDEIDCTSMTLIGGDMGILPSMYVKNVTLLYPNLYLFNRRGVCSVKLTFRNQLKRKEVITDIHFDSGKSCSGGQNKQKCETIDLDFKQNCNPVDCLIKYSGINSYLNPECKRCQKVPQCNSKTEGCFPDIAYSPYSNECVDLNIQFSKKDLDDIENGRPNENQITMINAICHYGKVTENGECLCHDGWTTTTTDEGMYEPGVAQHHLCNMQVGGWNCVNKNRIKITAILIAIFAITIISKAIFLMCVMTWCYKHFRKPENICAKQLDPEDPSVILCNDLDSFDKCLCCEPEEQQKEIVDGEKKPSVLRSQTVNVSYYPCSLSAFSSIKTSTGSSKYHEKTDESINLSHTSTSAPMSFLESDSSDESGNTNDTLFCEDQISNDIAYGVYCGLDDIDEKEMEVEEEEEEDEEEEKEEEEDYEESTTNNKSPE